MNYTVTATFKTYEAAQHALRALEAHLFTEKDISVILADKEAGKRFFHLEDSDLEEGNKVPEGAAIGGLAGGLLGAIAASVTAISSIIAPGIGLIVAGPVVAAFAGGAAGASAGGVIGALIGLGIPEHEAHYYEGEVQNGAVLLSVRAATSERVQEIRDIFRQEDADNIAA